MHPDGPPAVFYPLADAESNNLAHRSRSSKPGPLGRLSGPGEHQKRLVHHLPSHERLHHCRVLLVSARKPYLGSGTLSTNACSVPLDCLKLLNVPLQAGPPEGVPKSHPGHFVIAAKSGIQKVALVRRVSGFRIKSGMTSYERVSRNPTYYGLLIRAQQDHRQGCTLPSHQNAPAGV